MHGSQLEPNPFGLKGLELGPKIFSHHEENGEAERSRTTKGVSETAMSGSSIKIVPVRPEQNELDQFTNESGRDGRPTETK